MRSNIYNGQLGCIKAALEVLGDKWSPLIVKELSLGHKTYTEIQQALPQSNTRSICQKLEKLTEASIIIKEMYCPHPPRYKYKLTKKGEALLKILHEMASWSELYR